MAKSESFLGAVRRFFADYMDAMGTRGPFGKLVQRATEDPELRRRLVQSPRQVLAEAGVKLPEGVDVVILENSDKVVHLVLPPLMESGSAEGK